MSGLDDRGLGVPRHREPSSCFGCGRGGHRAAGPRTNSDGDTASWVLITIGWGVGVFAGASIASGLQRTHQPRGHASAWPSGARPPWSDVPFYLHRAVHSGPSSARCSRGWSTSCSSTPTRTTPGPSTCSRRTRRSSRPRVELRHRGRWRRSCSCCSCSSGPVPESPANYAAVSRAMVFGIGASLGGPTGYAINPARDLGPRAWPTRSCRSGARASPELELRLGARYVGPARRRLAGRTALARPARLQLTDPARPVPWRRRRRPSPPEDPAEDDPVHRRHRPGHHLDPLHDLRPLRGASWPPTSSSTSRSSRGPGGSSTTPKEIWDQHPPGLRRRARAGGPRLHVDRRRRHHQPARDHGGLGPRTPASPSTTRSSGRTPVPRPDRRRARIGSTGPPSVPAAKAGLPLATYFAGPEDQVDPRPRRGRPGAGRGAATLAVRHHRHLGAVERSPAARTAGCTSPT